MYSLLAQTGPPTHTSTATQTGPIHYLPIATTAVAVVFLVALLRRYRFKGRGAHLLWWAAGVACYGAGTALESAVTLFGNAPSLNKCWYVAGAILGAYPLAQGTVYLLLKRRTAHILTAATLPVVAALALLVALSPTDLAALEPHRPGGAAIGWSWIRMLTPLVNVYAVIFLVGGAVISARRFAHRTETAHRAIGNALIAIGALLPAIGGSVARSGLVEALYLAEFVGLILIWLGFTCCVRPRDKGASPAEMA